MLCDLPAWYTPYRCARRKEFEIECIEIFNTSLYNAIEHSSGQFWLQLCMPFLASSHDALTFGMQIRSVRFVFEPVRIDPKAIFCRVLNRGVSKFYEKQEQPGYPESIPTDPVKRLLYLSLLASIRVCGFLYIVRNDSDVMLKKLAPEYPRRVRLIPSRPFLGISCTPRAVIPFDTQLRPFNRDRCNYVCRNRAEFYLSHRGVWQLAQQPFSCFPLEITQVILEYGFEFWSSIPDRLAMELLRYYSSPNSFGRIFSNLSSFPLNSIHLKQLLTTSNLIHE